MWLRLMPITDPGRQWTISRIERSAQRRLRPLLMPLVYDHLGCSYLRAEDGMGLFRNVDKEITQLRDPKPLETESASFAFQ